jgi:hypothetical protein
MIEARHILQLCDRFEPYLMPLDIYILRQRYNGQTFKSTYTVVECPQILYTDLDTSFCKDIGGGPVKPAGRTAP